MNSFDRTFERLLTDKIKELRAKRVEDVIRGLDQVQYAREVGFIAALDEVSALCEETRKALSHE